MSDSTSPEQRGRIIMHEEGLGVASPEAVEQRARELAVIAGRAGSEFTAADFAQAKRELLEGGLPADDVEPAAETLIERDDIPGDSGGQVPNFIPGDESTIGEDLVNEGLEEALHDEMVEGHKKNIDAAS